LLGFERTVAWELKVGVMIAIAPGLFENAQRNGCDRDRAP
jgi:hypothetical protein